MANKQTILVIEDERNIGNYIDTILSSKEIGRASCRERV